MTTHLLFLVAALGLCFAAFGQTPGPAVAEKPAKAVEAARPETIPISELDMLRLENIGMKQMILWGQVQALETQIRGLQTDAETIYSANHAPSDLYEADMSAKVFRLIPKAAKAEDKAVKK